MRLLKYEELKCQAKKVLESHLVEYDYFCCDRSRIEHSSRWRWECDCTHCDGLTLYDVPDRNYPWDCLTVKLFTEQEIIEIISPYFVETRSNEINSKHD